MQRINRAIDYVVANLDQPLSLDDVAKAASFSPFHFHRVFRSLLGETLHHFIKRVRLERALTMLSRYPKPSLTEVGLACGLGSSSQFSRSFRQRFGVPPSAFDIDVFRQQRRDEWQRVAAGAEHRHLLEGLPPGSNPDNFAVVLRKLPARTVAYVRVMDPYQPNRVVDAAARMLAWARREGIADGQWLGYMWDDPDIVASKDCRYDIGLVVDSVRPTGEIGRIEFPAMTVAALEIRGAIDLEVRALDWIFKTWLPQSGFVPSDQPSFEAWIGEPFAHGMEHFELEVQIPVVRG